MTRFVVDCPTLLGIAAGEIEVAAGHQLVAPTLVRSQALASVYEAARRGELKCFVRADVFATGGAEEPKLVATMQGTMMRLPRRGD